MRIFVYEHVTGGGMLGESPSPGLVHEADLMLRTLLRDLGEVPGVSCVTTRDHRLPPLSGVECLTAEPGESPQGLYRRGVVHADAVWPTAPETGGALEQLGRTVLDGGRRLLGTHPDTVRVTAGKRATAIALARAGVPVVPTFAFEDDTPALTPSAWVLKPDDGAGAEDTVLHMTWDSAIAALEQRRETHVLQPWVRGTAASLSLLCAGGAARLLACNQQHVRMSDRRFTLSAITVNGLASRAEDLAPVAAAVAATFPGLWGYVGVDLILSSLNTTVLEVNPRLTTSWCGLRDALGANPAQWVIDLARTGGLPDAIPRSSRVVTLDLEPVRAS
ncbi:MAG: ATP-grasp domain-containing protein [Gemmatimonadales bacterium]